MGPDSALPAGRFGDYPTDPFNAEAIAQVVLAVASCAGGQLMAPNGSTALEPDYRDSDLTISRIADPDTSALTAATTG